MKSIFASILAIVLLATTAFAVDFNSIINENSKAQSDLHLKITETVRDVRIAADLADGSKSKFIADHVETIHVKTQKEFLTFEKEKKQYKPSSIQGEKRLAQEFKDLE
jgi:hypothetical protein